MSGPFGALASFFVAPPAVTPGVALPAERDVGNAGPRDRGLMRPSKRRGVDRRARSAATAVVGDAGAAAFAVDLAVVLAARDGVRCGVVAVWGAGAAAPPRGQATRAAEAVVGRLTAAGCASLAAGGRGVVVELPDGPAAAASVLEGLAPAAGEDAAVVLAICGPRPAALDGILAGCGRIVLVIGEGAPPALAAVAAASVGGVAPAARIVPVILETRTALPRPLRHRSAIRRALQEE
jgi:hypothetical protein